MASNMTTNDMLTLSRKFAQNLNNYGFNIKPEDIVECKFFDSAEDIGFTRVLGEHSFQLNINQQLSKENKTEFRKSLIYHELAHMIQYNEAFTQKVIICNNEFGNTEALPGKEAIAYGAVYDNFGHTAFWRDIVKDIQARIQFKVPITAYADELTIEKMLEELFVKEAKTYIDEKGHLVHVDYVIGGLTLKDIEEYSDKIPTRLEDLREALTKVDFSDVRPITPPGYKGPNATKYYIEKYIDENGNWRDPDEQE
jgi:hypothetical protein